MFKFPLTENFACKKDKMWPRLAEICLKVREKNQKCVVITYFLLQDIKGCCLSTPLFLGCFVPCFSLWFLRIIYIHLYTSLPSWRFPSWSDVVLHYTKLILFCIHGCFVTSLNKIIPVVLEKKYFIYLSWRYP